MLTHDPALAHVATVEEVQYILTAIVDAQPFGGRSALCGRMSILQRVLNNDIILVKNG